MNQKRKPAKPVYSPLIMENTPNLSSAREAESMSLRTEPARIGLRRNEWRQSNDDRQWW